MRARRQVVIMLATVIICFFICLLPFRLFTLFLLFISSQTLETLGMLKKKLFFDQMKLIFYFYAPFRYGTVLCSSVYLACHALPELRIESDTLQPNILQVPERLRSDPLLSNPVGYQQPYVDPAEHLQHNDHNDELNREQRPERLSE